MKFRSPLVTAVVLSTSAHASLFLAAILANGLPTPESRSPAPSGVVDAVVAIEVEKKPVVTAGLRPEPKLRREESLSVKTDQHPQGVAGAGGIGDSTMAVASVRDLYLNSLRHEIERRKVYPSAARALGETGRVEVEIVIERSGEISGRQIRQSSGAKRLDQAAVKLIHDLHRFQPIPDELALERWKITVPIDYRLN